MLRLLSQRRPPKQYAPAALEDRSDSLDPRPSVSAPVSYNRDEKTHRELDERDLGRHFIQTLQKG